MKPTKITIRIESWACAQLQATPLRYEVFVLEQNVPAELEMDEIDRDCDHALAFIDSEPRDNRIAIATGRLLPDGHIGRMAVQLAWRGKGVGRQVLHALVERARTRFARGCTARANSGDGVLRKKRLHCVRRRIFRSRDLTSGNATIAVALRQLLQYGGVRVLGRRSERKTLRVYTCDRAIDAERALAERHATGAFDQDHRGRARAVVAIPIGRLARDRVNMCR